MIFINFSNNKKYAVISNSDIVDIDGNRFGLYKCNPGETTYNYQNGTTYADRESPRFATYIDLIFSNLLGGISGTSECTTNEHLDYYTYIHNNYQIYLNKRKKFLNDDWHTNIDWGGVGISNPKITNEGLNDSLIGFANLFEFFDLHFIDENKSIIIICKQSTIDDMIANNIDSITFHIKYAGTLSQKTYMPGYVQVNTPETFNLLTITLNFPSNDVAENKFNPINSDYDSCMLIRTNPKLTGNVKLVVDSHDGIYLDTIKVPSLSILNETQYRHQAISDKGDYAHDVYTVFKSLPEGVLFNPGNNTTNPYTVYTDINDNYETLYEYGSETNDDLLYDEQLKIFAPLYLGKTLPKYFCIFRNIPVPHENLSFDNDEELKALIRKSEIVKIFDLRPHTSIGNYLNAYHSEINQYNPELCNLSFIDQEHKGAVTHVGRNSWFGVAVDKGIITSKVETTYFATDIIENNTQDELNAFLLDGFERNGLLYPRILNLEFMFNDDNAEEYKIYNYFGFYLSENDFIHFNQVFTEVGENNLKVYLDLNNEKFDIFDVQYNLNIIADEKFDDRLFFVTSPTNVANIASLNDLQIFINNYVCDKPLKSICNIDGDMIIPEEGVKSFMTLYFSLQLKAGEHIKFICQQPITEVDDADETPVNKPPIIFEIIMSNDPHLKNTKYHISPRIMTNNKLDDSSTPNAQAFYYRMTCFVDGDNNELASLDVQIDRIKRCINKFNSPYLHIESSNNNCIGLTSTLLNIEVQHILSNIPTDDDDIEEDIIDPLKYFNKTFDNEILVLDECHIENNTVVLPDPEYTNFGFDIIKKRYYTKEPFRNLAFGKYYQIHDNLKDKINNVRYPIVRTVNGYSALQDIDNDELTIISPFDTNKYMIHSPYEIEQLNGYINICEPISANISIMGIHAVKDFEMGEHEQKSVGISQSQVVEFEADENIELEPGFVYTLVEGEIKSLQHAEHTHIVWNGELYYYVTGIGVNTKVKSISKLQASTNVTLLKLVLNTDNINTYESIIPGITFDNYYNDDKSQLIIPIVPQVNFTWKTTSQYFDKNSFLNIDLLKNESINNKGDFNKNFSVIDFSKQNPLRKFITENNILTAVCHYNTYINKLSFIYYGIQFIWSINNKGSVNTVNLQKLNNYEIAFVNDYGCDFDNVIHISDKEKLIIVEIHSYDLWNQIRLNNVVLIDNNKISYDNKIMFELPYHYNIETSAINSNVVDPDNITTVYEHNPQRNESVFYGFYLKNKNIVLPWNIAASTFFVEYDKPFGEEPYVYNVVVDKSHESFDVGKMTISQVKNFVDIVNNRLDSEFNHGAEKHLYAIKEQYNIKADNNELLVNGFDINSFKFNYVDENKFGVVYDKNTISNSVKLTNNIKYQNDSFIPSFKNIIEFYDYDNEIDNELNAQVDSFGLNTKIRHVNMIDGYTCNKVLDNISFTYDKENNEHNYYAYNRSVLQMPTDAGIYRVYIDNDNYEYYSGYANGVRDKMMLASQCILLKSDITVDNYLKNYVVYDFVTSLYNEGDEATQELEININVTEHFIKHFTSDHTFMSNFNGLQKYDINNYILNTLTNYYNFDDIEVEVYGKFNETKLLKRKTSKYVILSRPKDDDFISYELLTNYKTECIIDNDNVILKITIPYNKLYTYYPIIKINRL